MKENKTLDFPSLIEDNNIEGTKSNKLIHKRGETYNCNYEIGGKENLRKL